MRIMFRDTTFTSFLSKDYSEVYTSRDHFLVCFFFGLWTFIRIGVEGYVPVSSLKLSSIGLCKYMDV